MKAITRITVYHLTGNLIRPLYTFWSLVNLLTAAQIHWNEGRSLRFSAQHSVKMEYLKVPKLYFFLVFFTKKVILIIIIVVVIIIIIIIIIIISLIFFILKCGRFRFQRWNCSYRAFKFRGNTETEEWKRIINEIQLIWNKLWLIFHRHLTDTLRISNYTGIPIVRKEIINCNYWPWLFHLH